MAPHTKSSSSIGADTLRRAAATEARWFGTAARFGQITVTEAVEACHALLRKHAAPEIVRMVQLAGTPRPRNARRPACSTRSRRPRRRQTSTRKVPRGPDDDSPPEPVRTASDLTRGCRSERRSDAMRPSRRVTVLRALLEALERAEVAP